MGLESATYIGDLNSANPLGTDGKSQGDDHLRLIKSTLQATFPSMAGAAWRVQAKAAGYTVVANDHMSVFNCTAALTLDLTAVATLGNNHMFVVIANGGDIVVDPNGAETINGAATVTILDGGAAIVISNGSLFFAYLLLHTTGATARASIDALQDVMTARGSLVYEGASAEAELAVGSAGQILNTDGTDPGWRWNAPRGYIDGLVMSNHTDTDHDISIAAGIACAADGVTPINSSSAIVKQIDNTWAAGSAAGGMNDGDTVGADEWFHVHALSSADGATVDFGFDTSLTAAGLLADAAVVAAGLTKYRRIGSVRTDSSSNILGFWQVGDEFGWNDPTLELDSTTVTTSVTTVTLKVPTGIQVLAVFNIFATRTDLNVLLRPLGQDDEAPSESAAPLANINSSNTEPGATSAAQAGHYRMRTNTSGQITARSDASSTTVRVSTTGWHDPRGRDA